ncbi:MAG: hypothetical protein JRH05_15255 [Deltaproteobacteria bacterium]|nr:hypothetical protein [Deltaproteobacteria bacterium]
MPQRYKENAVGCAECHTMRAASHGDSFDHNDFRVHPVVTPADCAVCHVQEHAQYGRNLMAYARINLLHGSGAADQRVAYLERDQDFHLPARTGNE